MFINNFFNCNKQKKYSELVDVIWYCIVIAKRYAYEISGKPAQYKQVKIRFQGSTQTDLETKLNKNLYKKILEEILDKV